MSYELCEKLKNLTPYEPVSGEYKIRLDANESFVAIDEKVKKEMAESLSKIDFNRYPDPNAKKLCKAFANYYNVDADFVTASNGSDEMINVIIASFLMKNSKVLTLSSDFSMYRFYADLAECQSEVFQKNDDLTVDVDALINKLNSDNIGILIFSNPCNPTSLGICADDVRRIIKSTSALVVLDEAYMDFWDESLLNEAHEYDNLIILKTCSKAVAMAAARVGFAVANKKITNAIRAAKSPYNVNTISQEFARVVLENKTILDNSMKKVLDSRDELIEKIKNVESMLDGKILVYDSVTNFVYIKTKYADKLFEYFKKNGIIIRMMGDCLRITAGTSKENDTVIKTMMDYFNLEV